MKAGRCRLRKLPWNAASVISHTSRARFSEYFASRQRCTFLAAGADQLASFYNHGHAAGFHRPVMVEQRLASRIALTVLVAISACAPARQLLAQQPRRLATGALRAHASPLRRFPAAATGCPRHGDDDHRHHFDVCAGTTGSGFQFTCAGCRSRSMLTALVFQERPVRLSAPLLDAMAGACAPGSCRAALSPGRRGSVRRITVLICGLLRHHEVPARPLDVSDRRAVDRSSRSLPR